MGVEDQEQLTGDEGFVAPKTGGETLEEQDDGLDSIKGFDGQYVTRRGKMTDDFVRKFEINSGGTREGAIKRFELLKKIPEGYINYGSLPEEKAREQLKTMPQLMIIEGPHYNTDGKLIEGYVDLVIKKKEDREN